MSESRWRMHYKQAIRDGEARRLADSRTIERQIKRAEKAEAEADRLRGLVDEAVNVILDIGANHILDAAASERCEQFYARAVIEADKEYDQ